MRYLLFFCLVLAGVSPLCAQSWKSDAKTVTAPASTPFATASPAYVWRAFFVDSAGNQIAGTSSIAINNPPYGGSSNGGVVLNGTINSQTRSSDFAILWGRATSGTMAASKTTPSMVGGVSTPGWIPMGWISAYKVGDPDEPQESGSGPYAGGEPVDDDGFPVDPMTAAPPRNSYKAEFDIVTPADSLEARYYKLTAKEGATIIHEQIVSQQPGETRHYKMTNPNPFTYTYQEVIPKQAMRNEEFSSGGSDFNKPDEWNPIGSPTTVNGVGQSAPASADGKPEGTDTKTAQNGKPAQPSVANSARPGTTEGNADARQAELRGELQRLTEQVRQSGDQTASKLGEISKGMDKLTGGGSGGASSGAALGTPNEGALSFVEGIGAKATGIGGALGGLISAAGFSIGPGAVPLSWSIPVMGTTYTVSVEEHAGVFSVVRSAILWVAGVFFVWIASSIVRGAFVEEGVK